MQFMQCLHSSFTQCFIAALVIDMMAQVIDVILKVFFTDHFAVDTFFQRKEERNSMISKNLMKRHLILLDSSLIKLF